MSWSSKKWDVTHLWAAQPRKIQHEEQKFVILKLYDSVFLICYFFIKYFTNDTETRGRDYPDWIWYKLGFEKMKDADPEVQLIDVVEVYFNEAALRTSFSRSLLGRSDTPEKKKEKSNLKKDPGYDTPAIESYK